MNNLGKLRDFVLTTSRLIKDVGTDEPPLLQQGQAAMKTLVDTDDWLPESYA